MTSRSSFRLVLTLMQAVCLAGCSSTSPSSNAVADFLTGVTASDGSVAARESGAPPAPGGGPTLTVTSSGSVSSGGNDPASLRASSPFQTVYVSVGGATGFYQLQLAAATTSITVTDGLASQIPTNSYVASYEVASSSGQVGAPASVTNTVQGGGSSQTPWQVLFSPNLNVSSCASTGSASFCAQVVNVDSTGAFHSNWQGLLQVDGTLLPSSVSATLRCVSGASTGTMSATSSGSSYTGTATFGGSTVNVQIISGTGNGGGCP
jgi:hypothetical protein